MNGSIKVDGKKFSRKEKIDPKTEYGKIVFAEKVVKKNQKDVDFGGFKDILNRVLEVLDDYKKRTSCT